MNIWFMLWVFFSVVILGTFLWSIQILMKQKMAWKEYAKKHSLNFQSRVVLASGVVSGVVRDFSLTVSSDPQVDEDYRGRRFLTIIQIDLNYSLPAEGVVGSPKLRRFVESLGLPEEFVPADSDWNRQACVRTLNAEALNGFFSPEKTKALNSLMSIKGVNVLFVFNEKASLLRFETPDPLDDASKLDRLVNKIIDVAKILTSD